MTNTSECEWGKSLHQEEDPVCPPWANSMDGTATNPTANNLGPSILRPWRSIWRDFKCSGGIARLQQATSAAVSTLLKVMVDASTPASTQVRAADSVLNHSAKAIELEDIEARVAALEKETKVAEKP